MVQPAPSSADLALLDPEGLFQSRLEKDRRTLRRYGNDIARLRVVVHKLAGAAGTFGYGELGKAAIAIDDRIAEGGMVTAEHLEALLVALDRAIARSA